MAVGKRSMGIVALVVFLVVVVAFLPTLRNMFAPVFPEGFRDVDCKGVNCPEGQFCQDNVCHKKGPMLA